MAELLKENLEADRGRSAQDGGATATALVCSAWMSGRASGRREVPDIISWIQCFAHYACVLGEAHPTKSRELWAYMSLIVREARRCGGNGWREYDSMFRQQAASAMELEWSKLDSSLYAVTFLAQQSGRGRICRWCQETDRPSGECALVPDKANTLASVPPGHEVRTPPVVRDQRGQGRFSKSDRVCYSWNTGRCRFQPYCRFRHICSTTGCHGDHRAVDCPSASRSKGSTSEQRVDTNKAR